MHPGHFVAPGSPLSTSLQNLSKIGRLAAELQLFKHCQFCRHPPSWILPEVDFDHCTRPPQSHDASACQVSAQSSDSRLIVIAIFCKRQRITLRLLYAIAIPSVVCLSVCRRWRWCTLLRRLNFSAIFFHHTIAQGLYFSGAKNRWWGTPLSPWNLRSKWSEMALILRDF